MRSSETIDEVFQLVVYYACDVTLSVYPHLASVTQIFVSGERNTVCVTEANPHRASLKNMPDHGGNRTYDHGPRNRGGGAMGQLLSNFSPFL